MKRRIIIVETQDDRVDNMKPVQVVFENDEYGHRAMTNIREVVLPDDQEILNVSNIEFANVRSRIGFRYGAKWLRSIFTCLILFILTSCAVYPEPPCEVWQPRHTGTYVECDTIIDGVTYYYFKKL